MPKPRRSTRGTAWSDPCCWLDGRSIPQREAKRRRVAGEEKKAHSWHPFQFYREAEEAKEPRAIIRHRKAKERFKKREREANERAAAEKKKAKAAEAAARETVDADELRRLEMEQREAKERAAARHPSSRSSGPTSRRASEDAALEALRSMM